jgi:hypothetical protein
METPAISDKLGAAELATVSLLHFLDVTSSHQSRIVHGNITKFSKVAAVVSDTASYQPGVAFGKTFGPSN